MLKETIISALKEDCELLEDLKQSLLLEIENSTQKLLEIKYKYEQNQDVIAFIEKLPEIGVDKTKQEICTNLNCLNLDNKCTHYGSEGCCHEKLAENPKPKEGKTKLKGIK